MYLQHIFRLVGNLDQERGDIYILQYLNQPEVHTLRGEILDLEVQHLEAGHRRGETVLRALLVGAEDVDRGRHIFIAVLTVEADVLDGVVVVGDLQHAVLGVAALDARVGVAGDGNGIVLGPVDDGQPVVFVVALLEVASVSGLHDVQAGRLEVVPGGDGDGPGRCGRDQLYFV